MEVPRHARDSRSAIRRAAAAEFAARGFRGAGVDRIARRAGINKAMIYYHFKDKAHLYHDIVREMFAAIRTRTAEVVTGHLPAAQKLDGFIDAIVSEASARPHLPPMVMREAAEGGRHLDPEIFRTMLGVFANFRAILTEGETARAFRRVDPILMYFTLVGPIVMYLTGGPLRQGIGGLAMSGLPHAATIGTSRHLTAAGDVAALGDHLKATARRALQPNPAHGTTRPAGRQRASRRRVATDRSGDEA